MLARLFPLLLLLITRDGKLHTLDGSNDTTAAAVKPVAIAVVGRGAAAKVAIVAGGKLTVDGKRVPGDFSDVRALAGGEKLFALAGDTAVEIALPGGRRTVVVTRPGLHRIAADGRELVIECDGEIQTVTTERNLETVGDERKWRVDGQPIALAAGDGKIWAATKKGPIVEIDRATHSQRALVGIGDWWTTLAMTYGDGKLYAVTLSGKIWKIDPGDAQRHAEKTIVAMSGWENALDLAVR
jgi:hypothetical protein